MLREGRCRIRVVGKRRDGAPRYWCLEHHADATAKYGRRARRCRYADVRPVSPEEALRLDVSQYRGGVAIWGAVAPIYDTTRNAAESGVHVHARMCAGGPKQIDGTFRSVLLVDSSADDSRELMISELDAIYYMVSSVFGFRVKYIECTLCGFPHLDKDWFSVHAHRRHLCAGCGMQFRDSETSVGNPIAKAREVFGGGVRGMRLAPKRLNIRQRDYPGGIQIWGSNPAIVWTAHRNEEEGIHVHAFSVGGETVIDDTFASVRVDGIDLDCTSVRTYMAQTGLPHIAGRIVGMRCSQCAKGHFDTGAAAFAPHDLHVCSGCGAKILSPGRFRKTVGNPAVEVLARLGARAVRTPQVHTTRLLVETL